MRNITINAKSFYVGEAADTGSGFGNLVTVTKVGLIRMAERGGVANSIM